MKFDSSLAWKQASAAISANREVSVALAGVFFMLPSLALELFFPQPEPTVGMTEQQIMNLAGQYYVTVLPALIPMVLLQALGTTSLLTLLGDRARPTVREAMRSGLKGVLPYLAAQFVFGALLGLVGGTLLGLFVAVGVPLVAVLGLALVGFLAGYGLARVCCVAPIVALEGERNPFRAIRRSLRLTAGQGARILAFFVLVLIAFLVIATIVGFVIGIPVSLLAGEETTRIVTAVVSSGINALVALYLVAMVAAVHRQLAGRSPEAERATFE